MTTNEIPKMVQNETALSKTCHYSYLYLGKFILRNSSFRSFFYKNIYVKKYEDILQQANLRIYPEEFFITSFFFMILLVIIYALLVVFIVLYIPNFFSFPLFFAGLLGITIGGISFYNYPLYYSRQRSKEIEAAIPHILPYLKLLSSDLSLSDIIKLMDEFTPYKELKKEFQKIRYYNEFLGLDLISSIQRSMKTSPSKKLSELMNDIIVISNSGGNVYMYLSTKVERMNQEIESLEKQTLESVMILSQIYIVFLLIGPLLAAVVLSVFSFISFGTIGGDPSASSVDTSSQIVYFIVMLTIIPPMYFIFYLIVYMVKPLYSRLQVDNE